MARNFPASSALSGHNEFASSVAEIPVQLLFSDDGTLGVAFLHHSNANAWSSWGCGNAVGDMSRTCTSPVPSATQVRFFHVLYCIAIHCSNFYSRIFVYVNSRRMKTSLARL